MADLDFTSLSDAELRERLTRCETEKGLRREERETLRRALDAEMTRRVKLALGSSAPTPPKETGQ